jgi:hypothetical protein
MRRVKLERQLSTSLTVEWPCADRNLSSRRKSNRGQHSCLKPTTPHVKRTGIERLQFCSFLKIPRRKCAELAIDLFD